MVTTESKLAMSMYFLTDAGKKFTLSMKNIDPELEQDNELQTKIEAAQASIVTIQPFAVTLEGPSGWALIRTDTIKPE